jgi:hypothetical protein
VTVPEEIVFGCGMGGLGGLMWDENGNFLDKDVFEKKIDSLIKDGTIAASDKEYFMERYDWCQTNGGGAMGVRGGGGCCGRGMNQSF